jgi:hypothetical protein
MIHINSDVNNFKEILMQILAVRKTGDSEGKEIYVQQIYVSGNHDANLSDACDSAFEQLRALGLNVQFRDDTIPEEVKTRILQSGVDNA